MRKFLIIIVLFSLACSNKNEVKKPEKFIEKEQMKNILYDLALLQAIKGYYPQKLTQEGINSKTYIYKKYNIDSIQFVENNRYYASDIEDYKKMFASITERLKSKKNEIDEKASKEQKEMIKNFNKLPKKEKSLVE